MFSFLLTPNFLSGAEEKQSQGCLERCQKIALQMDLSLTIFIYIYIYRYVCSHIKEVKLVPKLQAVHLYPMVFRCFCEKPGP